MILLQRTLLFLFSLTVRQKRILTLCLPPFLVALFIWGGGGWLGSQQPLPFVYAAPAEQANPVVRSTADCAHFENYAGAEPVGYAEFCLPDLRLNPDVVQAFNIDNIGFAHNLRNPDNLVTYTLNNFAGQATLSTNTDNIFGYDYDSTGTTLYALNNSTKEIGTMDKSTGAFTPLWTFNVTGTLTGLTIDPTTDTFYVLETTCGTATTLYTIDISTGITTTIGNTTDTDCGIDIAASPTGELYVHDIVDDAIYQVDSTTANATLIGSTGYNANFAQGMDFDPDDGTLYIFVYLGGGSNVFGTVDLTTGAVTPLAQDDPLGEFEGAIPGTVGVPMATDDSYDWHVDFVLTGENLLINDSDAGGNNLVVAAHDPAVNGSLWVSPTGDFVYTPTVAGVEAVSYTVMDTGAAVAYWSFNEGAGITTTDVTGNGHTGTFNGGVSYSSNAAPTSILNPTALSFDGVSGTDVSVANAADINVNDHLERTVTAWFNAVDVTSATPQVIWEEGGTTNGLNIYIENGTLYAGAWSETSGWNGNWISSTAITSGSWYHVAFVLDGTNNEIEMYLDGTLVGSAYGDLLEAHTGTIGIGAVNGDSKFFGSGDYTGNGREFAGLIDEVIVYNVALPESVITENVNGWIGAQDTATLTINVVDDGCFVEYTGDNVTDDFSVDASALQTAVDNASSGDLIKVAGTCAGVHTTGSLTQTVYINGTDLTLQGGYTPTNWLAQPDLTMYPTVLSAEGNGRVIYTNNSAVNLYHLIIQDGDGNLSGNGRSGGVMVNNNQVTISQTHIISNVGDSAGALYVQGSATVTVTHSSLNNNYAVRSAGIRNRGTLYIYNSDISQNASDFGGTAYYGDGGVVKIYNSTIANNIDGVGREAVYVRFDGAVEATNTTVSGNSAGLTESSTAYITLTHSTVVSNTGHGVTGLTGNITLISTIFGYNGGADCANGNITDGGYNLMEDSGGDVCGLIDGVNGNIIGVDPLLNPLANNGGDTWTHALQNNSPARNAIPAGTNGCGTTITEDQRGIARPQGTACDAGAFEYQPIAPVAVADVYTATDSLTLSVAAPGLLANDSDANGDTLTAVLQSKPVSGSLSLNGDGSFIYTPTQSFTGTDTFTYLAVDGAAPAVAYWPFGEGSGTTTADATGNGNDGTLQNGVSFTTMTPATTFANHYALAFDGVDDVVAIADSGDINLGTYPSRTVSVWFNADDVTITSTKQIIWEEGGTFTGANIYLYDGALYAGAWSGTNNWSGTWLSTTAVASGQWHHVALVLDSNATSGPEPDSLHLYLDGNWISSGSAAQLASHSGNIGIGNMRQDTKFHDGTVTGDGGHAFAGLIDDLRIHNLVLSPINVQTVMENVPGLTDTAVVSITFILNPYDLSVALAGTGSGTVTSDPTGINCGTDCNETLVYGTVITLTAASDVGSTFNGWTGACTGAADCIITIDESNAVTATFSLNQYDLLVALAGSGSGTVTSDPAGINCGSDCSETLDYGSVITLTAVANTGSTFIGWGGACSGIGDCMVTVTETTDVTATFTLNQYDLLVALVGSGSGTVTSDPAGIDCGSDCSETLDYGTVITLTAASDVGSTFTGWAGACTGTTDCILTIDAAKSVTATFTLNQYDLNVTVDGNGSGTISSDPAGITCPTDCTELFDYGTAVTLTATYDPAASALVWGGACSAASGDSCVVTIDLINEVTATFTLSQYSLGVTVEGNGSGAVTSNPTGIDCQTGSGQCTAAFDYGTVVTLTAVAVTGSTFTGWSGACSGTGDCLITMDSAKNITATFTLEQHELSVALDGSGGGTVTSTPAGIDCGVDCLELFDYGTVVTLTAVADADSTFTGWSGACTGSNACIVTMDMMQFVTATFAKTDTGYNIYLPFVTR